MSEDRNEYGYPTSRNSHGVELLIRFPDNVLAMKFGAALAYVGLRLGQAERREDGAVVYPCEVVNHD